MKLIRTDMAYRGEFSDTVEKYYNWNIEITHKPPTVKGFVPQTGRWQVERSFAWLNFFRRLDKDHERLPESSVAFIQVAFINIFLKGVVRNFKHVLRKNIWQQFILQTC